MIRVVTDSSCDLPDDVVAAAGIEVVPLTIRFGGETFPAGLPTGEFWERLAASPHLPETAAPSIGRFEETFHRIADEAASGILVTCLSGNISATCAAAEAAAARFGRIPVTVLDSRLASAALGFTALEAAERAAAGGTLEEVGAAGASAAAATNLIAVVDTLDFLRRGGRIGGAAAVVGNLLDVKPLISFSDGMVHGVGRVRTRRRAVSAVVDHLDRLPDPPARLAVIHSDPPDLEDVVAAVEERHGEPLVCRIGPVIGTHAGPGVVGVVYRSA